MSTSLRLHLKIASVGRKGAERSSQFVACPLLSSDATSLHRIRPAASIQSTMTKSKDPLARLAERQQWTAPAEIPVQEAVHAAFAKLGPAGHTVRNLLHGTWLHEPLHAVLVEIPVGSWTGTVVFDTIAALTGSRNMDIAADATNVLGLTSAVAAAVTGINDWADTDGAPRRIGAVHASLNIVATTLFGASWFLRRKRSTRTSARVTAAVGYVVVALSAHLGGNMIYEHGVGVQDTKPLS